MMRRNAVLVGALAGTLLATPVLAAAENVCLQHNRVMSFRAFNERTLIATDLQYKRYTVALGTGCMGLTDGDAKFVFRTWTNLGCLNPGDIIGVTTARLGLMNCAVQGVQAGAPAPAPAPG